MFRKAVISLTYMYLVFSLFPDALEEGGSLFNQGTALYQKGDYSQAYDLFSRSISIFEKEGKEGEEWLLNAYLWAGASSFYLAEYGEAESHYLESLELAQALDSIPYQSNIITALANLKFATAEYSEAGDWYLMSADLLRRGGSGAEANSSYEYGGYAKVLGGQYGEALGIFEEAISYSSSSRAASERAWLQAMRGNCRYYLHELPGALEDYLLAVSLLEDYGASAELTQYYGWAGKIFMDSNEEESALEFFHKSLDMADALNSREDRSIVLAYFGALYAGTGDFDAAASYYEDSLKVARSLGRSDMMLAAYESLAWIYEESGRMDQLKKINEKLIDLYSRENRELKLASLLNDQGLIFYNNKNYSKAIGYFEQSVELYRKSDRLKDLSVLLLNLAMAYENTGNMNKAEQLFQESLTLSIELGNGDDADELVAHLNLIYSESFDYEKLIGSMEALIPLYRSESRFTELMHLTNNIGTYYYALGDYEKAILSYQTARELSRQVDSPEEEAAHLHNIAQAKASLSRFDESYDIYNQSLLLAEKHNRKDIQASVLNSLGELYRAWGWYERSLDYYARAETLFREVDDISGLASAYNNMGQAVRLNGDPEASMDFYEKALDLSRESGDEESEAINLSNLGEAYRESGRNDKALEYYAQALQIDNKIRNLRGIQIRKNNMALIYLEEGKIHRAREIFSEALQYWRQKGNRREEATALKNIWSTYFYEEDYENAATALKKSVEIVEELRLTARGDVRREYLDSQISAYRELATTYYFLEDVLQALYYLELSRGKYLMEQLDISGENVSFDWMVLQEFLRDLDSETLLLSYSIVDENIIQAISVERDNLASTLITIEDDFLENMTSRYGNLLSRYVDDPQSGRFESLLKLYRLLLARPFQSRSTEAAIRDIGDYLCSRFIDTFAEEMEGKGHLILIPDGLLGTIPFGALTDYTGRYLIEDIDISYAQSLTVAQHIHDRVYSDNRKPLLAMGGAVYEESTWTEGDGERDLSGIRQNVSQMIRNGVSTRGIYNSMGYKSWSNLPGTLQEVNLLSDIVARSEILTGSDVTEEKVKSLSSSGELSAYEVLHLATHGIVIPDVPELSAVVLSQFNDEEQREDGYLTMGEISRLDIEADFVNLSACETGLGKIYQGEGVVGLTQAFLVAGANALSVSLWQVSDDSTMKFMTGVYTLVEEQGMSYAQAISQMKRIFLKDKDYNKPFYWAPFVFYGNYEAGL